MFIDARDLLDGVEMASDVCIVGGGPAGITLARELAASGVSVVLLEAGGLERDTATQRLYAGRIIGRPYFPLDAARLRYFAGSSNHWLENGGLRSRPLEPEDFTARDWIPHSGWPFGRDHLDAYYARAQAICGLGPYEYAPEVWLEDGWKAFETGDLHTEVFQYGGQRQVFRQFRANFETSERIQVYLNANVTEIVTDGTGSNVTAVVARTLTGRTLRTTAHSFVIAAGGIENPRLLLASNAVQPAGLGNQNDLVGRFFMEHPHVFFGRIVPTGASMADLVKTYVRQRRHGTDVTGVITIDARRRAEEGLANISTVLVPEDTHSASAGVHAIRELLAARRHNLIQGNWRDLQELLIDPEHRTAMARLLAPLSAIPADLRSIATTACRRLARQPARPGVLQMLHTVEQVPNPDSRVLLSRDQDRLGNLRASLDWRPLAQDFETIAGAERIIDAALRDAGLGYVEGRYDGTKLPTYTGSWHDMGTTRMSNDPRHGVVDASCKVHGISNLFIAGSSVFPTAGYTTPTLTIVALPLRLAEHLTAELKG